MVIDFHIHAFDDAIAKRAIDKLEGIINKSSFTNGTISDTLNCFDKWGVDKGVLLPIATKPSQQNVINNWSIEQKSDRIIPFGSIHPNADDALEELERIKSLGLKGIKLHPDYQNFFIDDEKLFPIYEKCAELDLPIVFHSGYDPLSPDIIHAMPENSARAFKAVPNMTMILGHFGGMNYWDDVEKYIVGLEGNLYLDTAYIAGHCKTEQLTRIIKNHGADRILFASDCPWHEPTNEIEMIRKLDISNSDRDLILYKNAMKLLNL